MSDYKNDIDRYLKGELTPAEMYALEKRALDDPFLADALEGVQSLQPEELSEDVKLLQSALNKRLDKKHINVWNWTGRIAAGLLIVALSGYFIWQNSNNAQEKEKLALNKSSENAPAPGVRRAIPLIADSIAARDQELSDDDAAKPVEQRRNEDVREESEKPQPRTTESIAIPADETPKPVTESIPEAEERNSGEENPGITESAPREERIAGAQTTEETAPAQFELQEKDKKEIADELAKADRERSVTRAAARKRANSLNVGRKIIRGKVTSAEDGTGLPGVNVLVRDTNEGAVTDGQGNYELAVNQDSPTLLFSFIGFNSKEAEVTSEEMNVALETDVSELSEVVVVGYGSSSDASNLPTAPPVMELATPEGGRKYFKKYLEDNMRYPQLALENEVEGKVTIQFTVGTGGQLSDFRVIRGIGYGCDEEVIRLIKTGPKWSPTKRNEEALKDRVRVRMRFALPKK